MTQLEIELDMCKKNFRFFLGYCFLNIMHRPFHFYQFHNDLIHILLSCEEHNRTIINAPPRIGKTEIVKHFIAWQFLRDPTSSVIYVSYDEALVGRKNREIKDLLVWLSKHFGLPDLKMLRQANGKREWVNRANGTILARGSNNGITGSGCSTVLVVDDPNKPEDRTSPTVLTKRNRTFSSTIRNRINDPSVPIIVIQQRIACNDLTGYLLGDETNEHWDHYNFPAINPDGTALCPERLPLDEIEKYRNDPFTYNAQYLQVPLDDIGNLFERSQLLLGTTRPPAASMRIVISVDAAMQAKDGNDYNAISVIGMCGSDFYIMEILNFRADITVLIQRIRELRARWGNTTPVLFEAKANGVGAAQILRKEMTGILETTPNKDKLERALVVKYLFDALNVHFTLRGLVWGEVQSQFTQFPHGKHDDIVDSVVQGITWLNALPRQRKPETPEQLAKQRRPVYGRRQYASTGYNPGRRY